MTANLIKFGELNELHRHNLETEINEKHKAKSQRLTAEAAVSQSTTAASRALEDARHNREQEQVSWWNAFETQRHNQAGEQLGWYNAELTRQKTEYEHARGLAQIAINQQESDRSYDLGLRNAAVAERNARANETNAATNVRNAATREAELRESVRHNKATESYNYSYLGELGRANRANEAIANIRNTETARSNRANEAISRSKANETKRANLVAESQRATDLRIANRNQKANEQYLSARSKRELASASKLEVDTVSGVFGATGSAIKTFGALGALGG